VTAAHWETAAALALLAPILGAWIGICEAWTLLAGLAP
jgi:hypothetical protein